jgi:hypothetical protein
METFLIALAPRLACCTRPGMTKSRLPHRGRFGLGANTAMSECLSRLCEFIAIFGGAALAMTDAVVE